MTKITTFWSNATVLTLSPSGMTLQRLQMTCCPFCMMSEQSTQCVSATMTLRLESKLTILLSLVELFALTYRLELVSRQIHIYKSESHYHDTVQLAIVYARHSVIEVASAQSNRLVIQLSEYFTLEVIIVKMEQQYIQHFSVQHHQNILHFVLNRHNKY
ncbi:Hypothetical_protein [Hexamita inflata]|uniref:Hypothetical_protein n=1 Tax=Hexamita inflata TaxID=28002 RepID=A0AA86TKT8_9EUKA|nr:Hypothetical protein HINF_LOCUS8055 [Hexamita inflata]